MKSPFPMGTTVVATGPDVTAPVMSRTYTNRAGTKVLVQFNERVTNHAGFHLYLEGDELPMTYASGAGTRTLSFAPDDGPLWKDYVYTISYGSGDVTDLATEPNALEAFSDEAVTNHSLYVPDFTEPVRVSTTIAGAAGAQTITRVFSEPVAGHAGFTLTASGGALTETYVSGEGTTTFVSTPSRTVHAGETITEDYAPGDVEDLSAEGPNGLVDYADAVVANNSTVEAVAPTLVSATIDATGEELTLVFSEAVTEGADGHADFALTSDGGAVTLSYVSGLGSATLLYATSRVVDEDETLTLDFTQLGDGIQDLVENVLESFADAAVVNGSEVPAPAGTTANMAFDFSAETPGSPITQAMLDAAKVGGSGYTLALIFGPSHTGGGAMLRTTVEEDLTSPSYGSPFVIGGDSYDAAGDLVIVIDHTGRSGNDGKYEGFGASREVADDFALHFFLKTTLRGAPGDDARVDICRILSGSAFVVSHLRANSEAVFCFLHTDDAEGGGFTTTAADLTADWAEVDLHVDAANGRASIMVRADGEIIFAADRATAATGASSFDFTDYLNLTSGETRLKGIIQAEGADATFPMGPWTMSDPQNVVAAQTPEGARLTFDGIKTAFYATIQRNKNSGGWVTLEANYESGSYSDSDVVATDVVQYRVQFHINATAGNQVASNTLTISSATWTDVNSSGATDTNGEVFVNDLHWTAIALPTGTATKIRANVRDCPAAADLRLGLFDPSGDRVATGVVAVSTTGYAEISLAAVAITAGNYSLAWTTSSGPGIYLGYQDGVGTLSYKSGVTPNTMPATLYAADGTVSRKYAVGVFVA
jgi:hypothetical protein